MKKLLGVLALSSVLMLGGCYAGLAVQPAPGMLFAQTKGPFQVVDASVKADKVGKASVQSILGIYSAGDASLSAAMANGGITKVHHVDYECSNLLGIMASYTVVVYGE